jgi:hypothetical protein
MDNLHPTMAAALCLLAPPPEGERLTRYRQLLRQHDWSHEHSDDFRAMQRGRMELARLRELQRELDPDFRIWNAVGHPWCRDGATYPPFPPAPATND